MITIAKYGLMLALFGQLYYLAAVHFVSFPRPAIATWSLVYLGTLAILFSARGHAKLSRVDQLFALCAGWLVFSFAISGESSPSGFATMMAMYVIPPYVCARLLGRYLGPRDFKLVYGLMLCMLPLMLAEYVRDPTLFQDVDRLRIFNAEDEKNLLQGGTAFFTAYLFGGALVVAASNLTLPKEDRHAIGFGSRRLHLAVAGISATVVLLWGSRGAILALVALLGLIGLWRMRYAPMKLAAGGLVAACLLVAGYFLLPPGRQALINDFGSAFTAFGGMPVCVTEGSSVLAHLTLAQEGFRLWSQSPLFGVGASNFGLYWCGTRTEFASPHSTPLHILTEMGILGLIPWLLLYGSLLNLSVRHAASMSARDRVVTRHLVLLWGYTFLQLVTGGNIFSDYHLYIFTGLLAATLVRYEGSPRPPALRRHDSATAPQLGLRAPNAALYSSRYP